MEPAKIKKISGYAHLKAWIHNHPAKTYALSAIGLVIAGSVTTAALLWQQPKESTAIAKPIVAAAKPTPAAIYYSPLTGEVIPDKAAATKPVTAIMIENSPSARPQSGLKDAEIVYEAVAEGGITRFLALYQQHQPELIGPVRSVRMYYVDWLTPYDASVAHVGGSAASLQLIRNGSYRDIDQFFNAGAYWRASDRYAPHNVYTSFSKLRALNDSKGYKSSKPISTERADDPKTLPAQDATNINVAISGPLYNSSYSYDPSTKLYARSQAGAPHVDREAGQIQARVVVALRVTMQQVMEDGYRESITTSGTGEAVVFQDGHAEKVIWSKESRDAQLKFRTADAKPFNLDRGTTWITAVPISGGNVSWK